MDAQTPVDRVFRGGVVALACLALLAGCVGTSERAPPTEGPTTGTPVTDYETFVFD